MYSLDYHTIRNYLYVKRTFGEERATRHARLRQLVVDEYNVYGAVDERLKLTGTPPVGEALSEAGAEREDAGAGGRTGRGGWRRGGGRGASGVSQGGGSRRRRRRRRVPALHHVGDKAHVLTSFLRDEARVSRV